MPGLADTLRLATFHSGLGRDGPGLMIRDLMKGEDQAEAALAVIAHLQADILLLGDVDWDASGAGAATLIDRLAALGLTYPHHVALRPNSGLPSGADLDGNGRLGEARDALGYGRFRGDSGLLLLSRHPIRWVQDHSVQVWNAGDLVPDGVEVPIPTVAQWVVDVAGLQMVTLAAGPPVFDGPEDRNGHRNAAELALARTLAEDQPQPVLIGRANLDPYDGQGQRAAITSLLEHPAWSDPAPRGLGGGGQGHRGDPALDTANWEGPGPLRVDYILPAAALEVTASGVLWPAADDPLADMVAQAGSGRAVWVDIQAPQLDAQRVPE